MRTSPPLILGLCAASAVLCAAAGASAAPPIDLAGTFGYLGEYEISARLAARDGSNDYAGPLLVRHVGLCTHEGPQEMRGDISLARARTGARATAVLTFNGRRCTFSGALSEQAIGELTCADAAVPASLWPRER